MDAAQPTIDSGLQNVQRHCAVIEQYRVERPDIEARAQRLFRPCPQAPYLPSAQAARQCLAGQRQVAIDLVPRGCLVDRQLGLQVIDRLLASPALRVQAGVDHQSGRAAHLDHQGGYFRFWIAVKTHFLAERCGVQTPAFDEGRIAAESTERRQVGALLLDGELVLVSGHRLLEKKSA